MTRNTHGRRSKNREKRVDGFRSGTEKEICEGMDKVKIPYEYEKHKFTYRKTYITDLRLMNGIITEIKGEFDSEDMAKMLAVKRDNPDLEIRFIFCNSKTKIPNIKKYPKTYGEWAEKNGFTYVCLEGKRKEKLQELLDTKILKILKAWSEE